MSPIEFSFYSTRLLPYISLTDYTSGNVPTTVIIPAGDRRTCFNSSSLEDDDDAMEPDETFMLNITMTNPDDPRIFVGVPTTTVIIVDSDGKS